MSRKQGVRTGNVLRQYEATNLLFFLAFVLALGAFVAFVFKSYKDSGKGAEDEANSGIVSEVVAPSTESCMYYLSTRVSETSHRYRTALEIPPNDSGLVRDLFAIPGVIEVLVAQRLIVVQKSPSARWELIQPRAREVIEHYLGTKG